LISKAKPSKQIKRRGSKAFSRPLASQKIRPETFWYTTSSTTIRKEGSPEAGRGRERCMPICQFDRHSHNVF
jgi:hypothetical protein